MLRQWRQRRNLRRRPAAPARLGLDAGWAHYGPTFLQTGLPWLVVDHRLIPAPTGGERLGSRNPARPWPALGLTLGVLSPTQLVLMSGPTVLAWTELRAPLTSAWLTAWTSQGEAILVIANTWHVELTQAAIFDGTVGLVADAHSRVDHRQPLEFAA